jgi:hypothetical protein
MFIRQTDDTGFAEQQLGCNPLQQHIAQDEFDVKARDLSASHRARFRAAYGIYQTDGPHGLQEAGQIVEAFIMGLAKESVRKSYLPASTLTKQAATVIDELYACPQFHQHRAVLGGAREFMKDYRNVVSHAPRSAAAALAKIHRCRDGFLRAMHLVAKLQVPVKQHQMRVTIH